MTVEPQIGNVTIAAARNLSKVTSRGQTLFDLSEYNYQLNPNDVSWNFRGECVTEGWDNGQFSGHKEPGISNLYIIVRRVPKGAAPPPPPPPGTGTPQTLTELFFGPEGILGDPAGFLKEQTEEAKKTVFLVIAGIIIVIVVLFFAFRPTSPSPAQRMQRQVQVRRVRVGEVGVDPATRAVGVKDVEVAAR